MNSLPLTPDIAEMAARVIWFEDAATAISNPIRFVAYAMTYGTHEDMEIIRRYLTDPDLLEVLSKAPAGIFDRRSWAYWNVRLGRYSTPPMPQRIVERDERLRS
jgi:hypothetical protein